MNEPPAITIASPEGVALLVGVAGVYLGIRLLPRLLAGWRAYLSPQVVHARLEAGETLLLLDVRSRAEFGGELGHLRGSVTVPLGEPSTRLASDDALRARVATPVVAICRSDARAAFAVRILRRAGFEQVNVLSGGMAAWVGESLPVEYGPPPPGAS